MMTVVVIIVAALVISAFLTTWRRALWRIVSTVVRKGGKDAC